MSNEKFLNPTNQKRVQSIIKYLEMMDKSANNNNADATDWRELMEPLQEEFASRGLSFGDKADLDQPAKETSNEKFQNETNQKRVQSIIGYLEMIDKSANNNSASLEDLEELYSPLNEEFESRGLAFGNPEGGDPEIGDAKEEEENDSGETEEEDSIEIPSGKLPTKETPKEKGDNDERPSSPDYRDLPYLRYGTRPDMVLKALCEDLTMDDLIGAVYVFLNRYEDENE